MNKNTTKYIFSDLRSVYKKARAEYESIAADWNREKEKYQNIVKEHNYQRMTDRDFAVEQKYHEDRENEYKGKMSDLKTRTAANIADCRATLASYIDEYYIADAEKMDQKAVDLLNSGIMTGADLDRMAGQFKDNDTMLRIIRKHADEIASNNPHNSTEALTARKVSNTITATRLTGDADMKAFDDLALIAIRGVNAEEGDVYTAGHDRHFDAAYDAAINALV